MLAAGEIFRDDGGDLVLTLPVRARFHGGRTAIIYPSGSLAAELSIDMNFVKATARAQRWRRMFLSGEVALRLGQDRGHVGLTLKLANLSPAIARAIVQDKQPTGLHLSMF